MRSLVIYWYQCISQSATVPGWKQYGFWVPLLLGTCLSQCKRGIHPQEALSELDNLLLFVLHALATDFRAAQCFFWFFSLWCFGQESAGGFFYGTSPGPAALFPAGGAPPGPPSAGCECWLPPCWVDSWCPSKPLAPIGGRRYFNAMDGDALGIQGSVRKASPFHFGVVSGEGITGLGCLPSPLCSFWRFPPGGSPGYSQTLLVANGSGLVLCCQPFPLFFPVHKDLLVLSIGFPLQLWSFTVPNPWGEWRDYWHPW